MTVSAGHPGALTTAVNKQHATRLLSTRNLNLLGILCILLTIGGAFLATWQLRNDRITEVWQNSGCLEVHSEKAHSTSVLVTLPVSRVVSARPEAASART
jgi:hypothetical protein